jgi:general secretion pathway protein L
MAEFLVIRIGADDNQTAEWLVVDSNGSRRGNVASGPLTEAAEATGEREVIVLVPATNVLTTTIDLPIRGSARIASALPFALEESLADDIENLHFVAGPRRENGMLPVAVVAHDTLSGWLDSLQEAGITPSMVVPETYGLARIPGTLSVLVAGDQVIFNDGGDVEFVMEDVKPSDTLAVAGLLDDGSAAAGEDASRGHLLVYCDAQNETRFQHDWIALRHELTSVDLNLLPDGALPRMAVTVAAGAGVNLLQGRYGPKKELRSLFRPWRLAALLLLGFGVVGIGGKAVETWQLGQEASALQAQFTTLYRGIQPASTTEIVDPVGAVNSLRRSLGGAAATTAFLPGLEQLGSALQQHQSARIEAISYRAGVIDIRLNAPDVATLDSIQRAVSTSGRFNASIQSTDQDGDRVNSRIQIREAGA